jgi:hypothetical protein
MDADSSAGQIAVTWARRGMRAYEKKRRSLMPDRPTIISETSTPGKETGCVIDGLITTVGKPGGVNAGIPMHTAVLECRARFDLDRETLEVQFKNKLLLTKAKMDKAYGLSRLLHCEFWLQYILVDEEGYYIIRISDANGKWIPEFEIENKEVRKTINDPTKERRDEALIDMGTAHYYKL